MSLLMLLVATAAPLPVCAHMPTQGAMNACAALRYRQADAAMTARWRITLAAMRRRDAADTSRGGGFGYAAALLAAQRAWLGFRDAQCIIEGGEMAGGSAQAMVTTDCKTRLTRARTAQLKTLEWTR